MLLHKHPWSTAFSCSFPPCRVHTILHDLKQEWAKIIALIEPTVVLLQGNQIVTLVSCLLVRIGCSIELSISITGIKRDVIESNIDGLITYSRDDEEVSQRNFLV